MELLPWEEGAPIVRDQTDPVMALAVWSVCTGCSGPGEQTQVCFRLPRERRPWEQWGASRAHELVQGAVLWAVPDGGTVGSTAVPPCAGQLFCMELQS